MTWKLGFEKVVEARHQIDFLLPFFARGSRGAFLLDAEELVEGGDLFVYVGPERVPIAVFRNAREFEDVGAIAPGEKRKPVDDDRREVPRDANALGHVLLTLRVTRRDFLLPESLLGEEKIVVSHFPWAKVFARNVLDASGKNPVALEDAALDGEVHRQTPLVHEKLHRLETTVPELHEVSAVLTCYHAKVFEQTASGNRICKKRNARVLLSAIAVVLVEQMQRDSRQGHALLRSVPFALMTERNIPPGLRS